MPLKQKGRQPYSLKRIGEELRKLGYNRIIIKSDQEPAIISVITEVGKLRAIAGGGKYIVEIVRMILND